ncbi:MAG: hypothetical protein JJU28_08260 [Cyclobacteriaceae bacterium]|nr:hypothetical protein [Cyclobacteriaceae bacterium]
MTIFVLYLVTLLGVVFTLFLVIKPFRERKRFERSKIKFIPLQNSHDPEKKFYVLNSGELVEFKK